MQADGRERCAAAVATAPEHRRATAQDDTAGRERYAGVPPATAVSPFAVHPAFGSSPPKVLRV